MTTLDDGRVLVVGGPGGPDSEGFTAAAKIWDPATEAFEPTGSLAEGRAMHTATHLSDGRVLIIGGTDGDRAIAAAEDLGCRDRRVRNGRDTRPSATPTRRRCCPTGASWSRAAGTGPASPRSHPRSTVQATETFSPTGPLLQEREAHASVQMDSGGVLVVGGRGGVEGDSDSTISAELWDPATESFRPAGSLQVARLMPTATLLPDGRVLVVAGVDPETEQSADGRILRIATKSSVRPGG